jgi:hypothetical protein
MQRLAAVNACQPLIYRINHRSAASSGNAPGKISSA